MKLSLFETDEMTEHQKLLDKLSKDPHRHVRWRVAMNTNTHPSTLHNMRNDDEKNIRFDVIANKNTPIDTIKDMAKNDHEWYVALHAQQRLVTLKRAGKINENDENLITNAMLDLLKDDTKSTDRESPKYDYDYDVIKHKILYNRHTPPKVLDHLANDPDDMVRIRVACHPNTPTQTLIKLAKDPDWTVREAMGSGRSFIPSIVIDILKKDSNHDVRDSIGGYLDRYVPTNDH